MKPVSTKLIFAEVASEWHLDVFSHCLMQLRGTWSALTCSYKCIMFWYFIHITLNTDIWNYFKMKRYFECEIKITGRWQQVSVNKWVIATEPNHLNGWFIQERNNIVLLLRDAKQCCSCLELFFVAEMERKQAIWCLKRKSLNINLLFIELLYKINITFVIMLLFEEKRHSSFDFNHMKWYIIYAFSAPISWILWSFLMHFIRLNHAVKEHTLNAHAP